jgi:TRAP-type C4-dicarboxylate transport system permease small subunit
METFKKILNSALIFVGGIVAFMNIRALLLHHQFVYFYGRGQRWVPTLVPALVGAWLFVFGLIGFIQQKRTNRSDPPSGE